MSNTKVGIPKGTRDFGPAEMLKRTFILDTIKKVFQKFGFLPLETPSIERLDVLTGKYGEEGDQLIFKILNSGDYLKDIQQKDLDEGYKKMTPKISKKALRYDLTVPFARYVAMNRSNLSLPFKRYQIQPVWRGDRPQKGRYQEFYQCDADVVGTNSLLCEAEVVLMMQEVLGQLGIEDYTIKINNRKILSGLAEVIGTSFSAQSLFIALDKLDKIGLDKVLEELYERGFTSEQGEKLKGLIEKMDSLDSLISEFEGKTEVGMTGIQELKEVWSLLSAFQAKNQNFQEKLVFDLTLARGLTYYTGAIFEIKVNNVQIGSISGGGRYDDLTSNFGFPDVSGVGFSFGVDRIYDVMEALDIFPKGQQTTTQVMFTAFDEESLKYALPILQKFREEGIRSEIFPDYKKKLGKQFNYANAKGIPFVIVIGSEERQKNLLSIKDMEAGSQEQLSTKEVLAKLKIT